MEIENKFSFEGKKVTVVGGKGKMGTAFAKGLASAGAKIAIVDRDTEPLGRDPKTEMILFALNERTTYSLITTLSKKVRKSIPLITTSSTNNLLASLKQKRNLIPIHPLSGPKMEGAVMIDCTLPQTLSRIISTEIARIMKMEQEFISLRDHDSHIAIKQASFHKTVWDDIHSLSSSWANTLTLSQRISAMGKLRVLLRPDISAELIASFPEISDNDLELPWENEDTFRVKKEKLTNHLTRIAEDQDHDGLIRDWVRTENGRMDEGAPGGPRSFQEFLRNKN